jgi:N-acyl amino acid synthase of PEP-CTERM/exosortase system
MSIVKAFEQYFEMIPATTDELKQEVYKLRYQVYCLEKSFEDTSQHSDGLEFDEYDAHSCHYLIKHKATGSYMATTRLILPDSNDLNNPFPIELHSQINAEQLPMTIYRPQLAELSRFCVSKEFRRRTNERSLIVSNEVEAEERSEREKKDSPNLTLALFACAIKMSNEHDIHHWYAIMEPALKRVFSALGIHFIQVGEPVDYHGIRIPCVINVTEVLNGAAEENIDYWNMLSHYGQY